jgi:UDP-glucose 4-epimerase
MTTILVTGASGFVGRPLCRRLVGEGFRTLGVVRRTDAVELLPPQVEPRFVPDLAAHEDWDSLLDGVDHVVHLAARAHVFDDAGDAALALYRRTNVTATRHLVQAAHRRPIRRFVHLSSIKAVGEGGSHAYDERTPCVPRDAYGLTKLEAERVLFESAAGTHLEPVVLRPPLVYGPEVRGNFLRLLDAVGRGLPLPLASVTAFRSLIGLDNLVDAVVAGLRHPQAAGHVFHVADDRTLGVREVVEHLARLLDRPARLFPVPPAFLQLAGRLVRRSAEIERLVGSLKVDCTAIRECLGWRPPVSVEQGLSDTVAWYRSTRTAETATPARAA